MGSIPRILHRSAKPIAVEEFIDAVRATCPAEFPDARPTRHRRMGLAISGGVDSMALAFLFSSLRSHDLNFQITDYPSAGFDAFVVDHKIRENSTAEARGVVLELEKLRHVRARYLSLEWNDTDPRALTNLETVARRERYRVLGNICAKFDIGHLFLGHHADDVHETVLMRMMAGHYGRGLMGVRRVGDIPECHGIYRANRSGLLDQMQRKQPPLTFRPQRNAMVELRKQLLYEFGAGPATVDWNSQGISEQDEAEDEGQEMEDQQRREDNRCSSRSYDARPALDQLEAEEGGTKVYRPLLEFEKERLVATCESNGISWVEDPSNNDPTLTPRNAIRHMVRNFKLPEALQRPAILRMAAAITESSERDEEEARVLLREAQLELRTNIGTLMVELPAIRHLDAASLERKRTIAALFVRGLIAAVTPDQHLPTMAALQNSVSWLFPSLATEAYPAREYAVPFDLAHVHLMPVASTPTEEDPTQANIPHPKQWFLSRAPHPRTSHAANPIPVVHYPRASKRLRTFLAHPGWSFRCKEWQLYDGRFWISLYIRMNGTIRVQPLSPEHLKPFKERLSPGDRRRLEETLWTHAPGKVRFTLPGIYVEAEVDWGANELREMERGRWTLLALPSLGIGVAGLERLLGWEVRYKKVDGEVLRLGGVARKFVATY